MWKDLHRNLGRIESGSINKVNFKFDGEVPEDFQVLKLQASCGCTKAKFNKETGILSAVYTAGKVPEHLKWKAEYTTTKKIKAITSKGDFDFTFKATIYTKKA